MATKLFEQKLWLIIISFNLIVTINGSVPLNNFIPFGVENGDTDLRPNNLDDGSSERLMLSIGFPFFDHIHDSLWVNINGLISLRNAMWQYVPLCETVPYDFRMIAPFWVDLDLTNGGNVFYRETFITSVLQQANAEITTAFPEFAEIDLNWAFVTTWSNLTFCCGTSNITNTFQSVLVSNGIYSFAIFYYNHVSGGRITKSGFDAGDGVTYSMIPGSCTDEIKTIIERSNVGTPGVWVFRVDNADIESPGCHDNFKGNTKVVPAFIDLYGNVPIHISGPCFNETIEVVCRFYDPLKGMIEVEAKIVENKVEPIVECIAPFLYTTGRILIEVVATFDNQAKIYPGIIYVIPPQDDTENSVEVIVNDMQGDILNMTFQWNANHFFETDTIDINLYTYNITTTDWVINKTIAINESNTGIVITTMPIDYFPETIFINAFTFSVEPHQHYEDKNSLHRYKRGVTKNLFRSVAKLFARLNKLNDIYEILRTTKVASCQLWSVFGDGPKTDLPACPTTSAWAERDISYESDPACRSPPCFFHPKADYCIRSRTPSNSGGGQQCCYKDGNILIGPPGGGTVDNHHYKDYYGHFVADVLPWILCCLDESEKICRKYYEKRPSDPGTNYIPPIPARGNGDPHINTFDHLEYTFNGYGEFWMIKNSDVMPMQLQARMEPFIHPNGTTASATVFTAFVMKSGNSSRVQVQRSEVRIVDIYVDGIAEDLSNELLYDMNYNGVQVSVAYDISSVTISFVSGFSFQITTNSEAFSIMTTCDHIYHNKTSGLLGVFDGNKENDLQDPSGHIIAINSSLQEIHQNFGLKWNILESESLFTYTGKQYADYNNLSFVPNFQTPDLESAPQIAKDICGDSFNCLYDYMTTGSATVANLTKILDEVFNETLEIYHTQVISCQPLSNPSNGYYHTDNFIAESVATYFCDENYTLHGDNNISCMQTGHWNATNPECQPFRAPTEEPAVETTLQTTDGSTAATTVISTVRSTLKPSVQPKVETTIKNINNNETSIKPNDDNTTTKKPNSALNNHLNYPIILIAIFIKLYYFV